MVPLVLFYHQKYLPTCMLGPLRLSMRKITKSDAKLFEIYEQPYVALFYVAYTASCTNVR